MFAAHLSEISVEIILGLKFEALSGVAGDKVEEEDEKDDNSEEDDENEDDVAEDEVDDYDVEDDDVKGEEDDDVEACHRSHFMRALTGKMPQIRWIP
jgi:hypothetical protein